MATVLRLGPLSPSAPASTSAAHAAALTHRHPLPPILEEAFPEYTNALANLPEEPTPITLPAFGPYINPCDDMEAEGAEADVASYMAQP